MSTVIGLLQNKYVKWGVGILTSAGILFGMVTKYQAIKRDREDIAAKLKEAELAYTHQAEQVKKLEQTIVKLRKQIYTTTVTLPNGTTITTTSEYVDSTTNTNSNTSTTTTPVFRPPEGMERYPLLVHAGISTAGWGVGPGWEVGRFNLPLLPYTYMGLVTSFGQTWEGKFQVGGGLVLQWGKK